MTPWRRPARDRGREERGRAGITRVPEGRRGASGASEGDREAGGGDDEELSHRFQRIREGRPSCRGRDAGVRGERGLFRDPEGPRAASFGKDVDLSGSIPARTASRDATAARIGPLQITRARGDRRPPRGTGDGEEVGRDDVFRCAGERRSERTRSTFRSSGRKRRRTPCDEEDEGRVCRCDERRASAGVGRRESARRRRQALFEPRRILRANKKAVRRSAFASDLNPPKRTADREWRVRILLFIANLKKRTVRDKLRLSLSCFARRARPGAIARS